MSRFLKRLWSKVRVSYDIRFELGDVVITFYKPRPVVKKPKAESR